MPLAISIDAQGWFTGQTVQLRDGRPVPTDYHALTDPERVTFEATKPKRLPDGTPLLRIVDGSLEVTADARIQARFSETLIQAEVGDVVTVQLRLPDRPNLTATRDILLNGVPVRAVFVDGSAVLTIDTSKASRREYTSCDRFALRNRLRVLVYDDKI